MKVDATFPQIPHAAPPVRPEPNHADQASVRPVERPDRDAAADDERHRQYTVQSESPAKSADSARNDRDEPIPGAQQAETASGNAAGNATQPSRVGELLDVLA